MVISNHLLRYNKSPDWINVSLRKNNYTVSDLKMNANEIQCILLHDWSVRYKIQQVLRDYVQLISIIGEAYIH